MHMTTAPSGPPQNFTLSVENTTLIFSWQPPAPENRNGAIISYTLSCTSDGESSITLMLIAILEISLYASPDTTFTCQIAASTSVGIGPYSEELMGTTGGIVMFRLLIRIYTQCHFNHVIYCRYRH